MLVLSKIDIAAFHFSSGCQSRNGSSSPGMGPGERKSYQRMPKTKQTGPVTPASSETLLHILETLPGALLVVDDAATIVYANARAQAMIGATREEVCGKS